MTLPKMATEIGFDCWKVRVVVSGARLHVLSRTEPRVHSNGDSITGVDWEPVEATEHGDSVGFIRWRDVSAITWRRA